MALSPIKSPTYYGNILVVCPKGTQLCTVDTKRVKWYLSRKLAKIVETISPYQQTVQLMFEPKGRPKTNYGLSIKATQCVVCGEKEELSLHHVVPHCIRRHFPTKHKTKQHLWCQLLCEKHHLEIERVNSEIIRLDGSQIREQKAKCTSIKSPQSRARLALYHIIKNDQLKKIPQIKLQEILKKAKLKEVPDSPILKTYLEKQVLSTLDKKSRTKSTFGKKFIKNSGGIHATKKLFKERFIAALSPKFLPYGALKDLQ